MSKSDSVCPECGGWGFDEEGRDCTKCDGIGELPFDIPPEPPPLPKPQPPEYNPLDPNSDSNLDGADWWKTGEQEPEPDYTTDEEDDNDQS